MLYLSLSFKIFMVFLPFLLTKYGSKDGSLQGSGQLHKLYS